MALYLGSEVGDWKGAGSCHHILRCRPGQASGASADPGPNRRETCSASWQPRVFAKPRPVARGPGSALTLVRDDSVVWSDSNASHAPIPTSPRQSTRPECPSAHAGGFRPRRTRPIAGRRSLHP
ncbi:hypothetical protein CVM73_25950 [Bradyrhizobium forestalis]|uniref:Uncharacterized protein n=1 Tax=Bradyrhizobium forestalis TaxID=1419263 RepID=A0A2M8R3I7_9BRAD|nr:hypothetical protein CVM73_25950 [Bradyrhizobium forestalis]